MKKNRVWAGILFAVCILLSLIGIWKSVYVSADIDESYAFTMAVRIAGGERMFIDLWEPHQMSAFLYAPLVWIYKSIAGNLDGALVFMRFAGAFVQALLSVWCYRVLRRYQPFLAGICAILYLNFTPKHIQSPEFTSIYYWMMMALILCALSYMQHKKKRYLVLAGLFMSMAVLCYPTALVLFLYLQVLFFVCAKENRKESFLFALTCFLAGVCFLFYLCIRGGGITPVLQNIPNVLSDASHKQSLTAMCRDHLVHLGKMLYVTAGFIVLCQVGRPVLDQKKEHASVFMGILLLLQAVWMVVQFHTIQHVNFMIFYPIVCQLFVIGWYAYAAFDKTEEDRQLFYGGVLLSAVALLAVLTTSNLTAEYSVSFLLPGVLAGLLLIGKVMGTGEKKQKAYLAYAVLLAALLLQLFAARILLVRFTSTQRKNIFDTYVKTETGVLSGIYLGEFDAAQYEAKYAALQKYVGKDDRLLYVGCDMFLYSALQKGQIATGNTISTPAFSDQLMTYYRMYPEKIPTVLFVDREYGADFSVLLEEEPLKDFVENYFDTAAPVTDGPLTVYVAKDGK